MSQTARGIKAALVGLLVNIVLVIAKLLAGIAGHSYALVADAIESSTDIFSSLVVWGGLRITTRPADEQYPYGYGKAESLAAAVVSLMLLGAAMGIAVAAVGEIITPHHMPAPFTLIVAETPRKPSRCPSRYQVPKLRQTPENRRNPSDAGLAETDFTPNMG